MRALEFGPIDELRKKYGNLKRLEDMPKDSIANPSVIFIPSEPEKKQVVSQDADDGMKDMSRFIEGVRLLEDQGISVVYSGYYMDVFRSTKYARRALDY